MRASDSRTIYSPQFWHCCPHPLPLLERGEGRFFKAHSRALPRWVSGYPAAAVLLAVHFLIAAASVRKKSNTFDEITHITGGFNRRRAMLRPDRIEFHFGDAPSSMRRKRPIGPIRVSPPIVAIMNWPMASCSRGC